MLERSFDIAQREQKEIEKQVTSEKKAEADLETKTNEAHRRLVHKQVRGF